MRLQFRTVDNIGDDFYAYIRNSNTNRYVFNQGDNNVCGWPKQDCFEEIWHFERQDNGAYKITSMSNGNSMDVLNYGNTAGTNVQAVPYAGNTAQQWYVFEEDAGCIFSAACTPCVLYEDSASTNVQMVNDDGNAAQWFAIEKIPTEYSWDVNGFIDGQETAGIDHYGTYDVWLNGEQVADDVSDYFAGSLRMGTTYEIRDIKVKDGCSYNGVYSGSLSGTICASNRFTLLNFSLAQTDNAGEPAGEATLNGHKYVYYPGLVTWYTAKTFCEEQGGHLVTITSAEENELVHALRTGNDIWLGGTDAGHEGEWKWITGESFDYKNWNSDEPNNDPVNNEGSENYLMLKGDGWNDIYGSDLYGFVLEIEAGTLELNGYLDGQPQERLSGYGTVDVYVDGVCVADDVEDYSGYLSGGSTYEIKDIKPTEGYSYDGIYAGSRTGVIAGNENILVLSFSTIQTEAIGEPAAELVWNGHKYVYYEMPVTWYTAKAFCEKMGGHLATITTADENEFVKLLCKGNTTWLGGTDSANEGVWEWVTGETFEYNDWRASTNEPNNSLINDEGSENYLVGENDGWNDNPGCILASFICEFEEINTYIVRYDANGGTDAPNDQIKEHGTSITISNAHPSRNGYTFLGWATSSTASSANYQPGDTFTIDADITLYAVWNKNAVESNAQIVVDSVEVMAGGTTVLSAELKNNPGFAYLAVTPVYDTFVLTLVSVENGEIIEDFDHGDNFAWSASEDTTENGALLRLTFKVSEDAVPGDYTVNLIFREGYTLMGEDVTFEIEDGTVTVSDILYGDANGDGTVNGKDVLLLRRYMAYYNYDTGTSTVEIFPGGDANGDGIVNGKDVLLMRRYMAYYNYDTGTSSVVLGPA